MNQITLFLNDPAWHASPTPVAVHWLHGGATQHLVVEAPNWANAWKWGIHAALLAYTQLLAEGEKVANPCDEFDGLTIRVIAPGFPLNTDRLWEEPFGRYIARPRNPPLVYPVRATPGSTGARSGVPLSLGRAFESWGEGFALQHPDAYGYEPREPSRTG